MMKKRLYIIIAAVMLLMTLLSIQVFACTPNWEFSGYYRLDCEPNSCGLFWKDPQAYYIEIYQSDCADENGNYTKLGERHYGGFGDCC